MELLLFAAPLLLVVVVSTLVLARAWTGAPKFVLIAFPIALLALLCVAFIFTALPAVIEMTEENVTVSMLNHHADEDDLKNWFRMTGADWHLGQVWESGEAFGSPGTPCRLNCASVLQVAFTHWGGLCISTGDRITMNFDVQRKLNRWSIEPAVDGC